MKQLLISFFLLVTLPILGRGQTAADSTQVAKQIDSLMQVSSVLVEQGKTNDAVQIIETAKKQVQARWGTESVYYAKCLSNQGKAYDRIGKNAEAEALFLEAKAIAEKAMVRESTLYATILNNLGFIYHKKGADDKALPMQLEAKAIWERTSNKEQSDYATIINKLAITYFDRGANEDALVLFSEARSIYEKTLGVNSKPYAQCLGNLANTYAGKGDFDKAISLQEQALVLRKKAFGPEHPIYAQGLGNLAGMYGRVGMYDKALPLALEAKAIQEKIQGKEHPMYLRSLNNLALIYRDKGDYEQSLLVQQETRAAWEKIVGKEHPYYIETLNNLATLYFDKGDSLQGRSCFLEANTRNKSLIQKSAAYSSELDMLQYRYLHEGRFYELLQFTQMFPNDSLVKCAYDNALFLNNALLFDAVAREQSITRADSSIRNLYDEWKTSQSQLAKLYSLANRDTARIAKLEEQTSAYERELVRRSPEFVESQQEVHWQEVQKQLKPNETAIEFVFYRFKDRKLRDSSNFAALVIRPEWTSPRMVSLFELRDIQPLIDGPNAAATAGTLYAARGEASPGSKLRSNKKNVRGDQGQGIVIPGQKSADLYKLIWEPIEKALNLPKNSRNTIYFAPIGLLHRLNFGAIAVPGTDQTLADQHHFVQVVSTRQLVNPHRSSISMRSAALYGGLNFDGENLTATTVTTSNTGSSNNPDALGNEMAARGSGDWAYLPGTEIEIKNIASALTKAGYAVHAFMGLDGSEAAFKTIGQKGNPVPTVLHIATHGFFFPDPQSDKKALNTPSSEANKGGALFKTAGNPLFRSGLILAGANPAWAGTPTSPTAEDGILTAYEISQMNLQGTELVVLSACETGLGAVEYNEGEYGLKRAFKIAGAHYLIMSLWQIPDKQTQELMSVFYKNWLEQKMDIPAAFEAAQKSMRKRYSDPFFWAGFVLVE
jgi:CHAT domain-containing protein